jgi:hypothetical protein
MFVKIKTILKCKVKSKYKPVINKGNISFFSDINDFKN